MFSAIIIRAKCSHFSFVSFFFLILFCYRFECVAFFISHFLTWCFYLANVEILSSQKYKIDTSLVRSMSGLSAISSEREKNGGKSKLWKDLVAVMKAIVLLCTLSNRLKYQTLFEHTQTHTLKRERKNQYFNCIYRLMCWNLNAFTFYIRAMNMDASQKVVIIRFHLIGLHFFSLSIFFIQIHFFLCAFFLLLRIRCRFFHHELCALHLALSNVPNT